MWQSTFQKLKPDLVSAENILAFWHEEIQSLNHDWTLGIDNNGHTWEGEPVVDSYLSAFQERLDEVGGTL